MICVCMVIMGFALGSFVSLFVYGWLDEREDAYAGLVIPDKPYTVIEWSLRKYSIPDQYAVQPRTKRAGGHLGHLDHKARQRLAGWIAQVPSRAAAIPQEGDTHDRLRTDSTGASPAGVSVAPPA